MQLLKLACESHAHGAGANARSEAGPTAMLLAANRGLAILVERLIAKATDANIEARDGWTAAL